MNRCPECNKRLRKDAESCPRCGWKKRSFGFGLFRKNTNSSDFDEEAYLRYMNTEDRVSFGLCFLSLLIPFFGLIYCACSIGKKPIRAMSCLLAPFFMPLVLLGIILIIVLVGLLIGAIIMSILALV